MIDEGDILYHPEWQRRYFSEIISFLPEMFPGRQIQLILASNSPFIASDLPKSNLIFLDLDSCNHVRILEADNPKAQTFGANIHLLLKDGFFLERTVGEFAYKTENNIIKKLKGRAFDIKDYVYCQQLIAAVGEPIVRNKLQEMLDDRVSISRRIEMVKKHLEDLEKEYHGQDR